MVTVFRKGRLSSPIHKQFVQNAISRIQVYYRSYHNAHAAKRVVRKLRKMTEKKTKDILGVDQFGFRGETSNSTRLLKIQNELWTYTRKCVHTSQIDRRHLTVQIGPNTNPKQHWFRMVWNRLIGKLYMDQNVKVWMEQGNKEVWRLEYKLDKDAVCHQVYSTYTGSTLSRELLKGFETSKEDK